LLTIRGNNKIRATFKWTAKEEAREKKNQTCHQSTVDQEKPAKYIIPCSPADTFSVRLYWHNTFFLWEESQNCLVGLISSEHGEQCTPFSASFFYVFEGNFQVSLSAFSPFE